MGEEKAPEVILNKDGSIRKKRGQSSKNTNPKGGPKETLFKKGNPGGPGRPKMGTYERLLKGKLKEDFYEMMFKPWDMRLDEIEKLIKDKSRTVPEQIFLRWFVDRMQSPSSHDLEILAKFCGIKLDHITVDNVSSDGSFKVSLVKPNKEEEDAFKKYPDSGSSDKV